MLARFSQCVHILQVPRHFHKSCIQWTQTQEPRLMKALKPRSIFGESGYILLLIPIATFCLGTWQVRRRRWKIELIRLMDEKTQSPPMPLPVSVDEVAKLEYRPVTVRGEFDHSREMLIGPRSNFLKGSPGMAVTGTGFNIVTPFKLADEDVTILVNRGWVPARLVDPKTREESQVKGVVELGGIVRLQEERTPFMPHTNPKTDGYWLYRDLKEMSEFAKTSPIFIDADIKSTIPGGPIGGQTRVTLRNDHLSYIITWYSLSAITFWMWYRRYHRPPPPISAFKYMQKVCQMPTYLNIIWRRSPSAHTETVRS